MKLFVIGTSWFLIYLLILIFSYLYLNNKSLNKLYKEAKNLSIINPTPVTPTIKKPIKDIRNIALTIFLNEYNSPLVNSVDELIKQADIWGIDYALIPAIAMQESEGCKRIPANSYNCWGFGIYGEKLTKFSSYEEAIAKIAKTIKETYIKNNLTNVTLLEDRWAPQSKGQWSSAVNFFIGKIRKYEKNNSNT